MVTKWIGNGADPLLPRWSVTEVSVEERLSNTALGGLQGIKGREEHVITTGVLYCRVIKRGTKLHT